ncbi:hypothetical protein SDJN03_12146, partial [Cucurbita argyrosperma subsp. sororia]
MAKKMMAVVLMCVLVVSALQFSTADKSTEMEAKFKSFFSDFGTVEAKFKSCAATCQKKCTNASCRSKCDADCGKKEVENKFKIKIPH